MYNCEICGKPDSLDRGGVILCHNCDVRKSVGTARKKKNPKCKGCKENEATMDLIYGEDAEQVRVPWCNGCLVHYVWDMHTYHHAEPYEEKKEDVLGDLVKGAQRVFNDIGEAIRENFIPKFHSPKVGDFTITKIGKYPVGCVTNDLYNRQPHYEGGIDPITYGKDNLSTQEMNGFYKMNVIKYVSRCDRKNGLEDLQKARDYLNLLIDSYENAPKAALTDAEKLAVREASLCFDIIMKGDTAIVKRKDVLEELEVMLQDVNYTVSSCGSGETYVELAE
ncbi:hypothetical protein vBBceSLY5_0050 [Bacillus phage vB_BceS_LY5]|uniref:hypothetical protein n=1 Tax=Bacillus phage vB_BceS_LY5 TaxID=2996058 RepID=UPI004054F496|nr:hypothetical protein vBBceSLY5_0050 [Bacillus phage vB_BceS_LY5]